MKATAETTVKIPVDDATLVGDLAIPSGAQHIILFAHGSGSSRLSSRKPIRCPVSAARTSGNSSV